MLSAAQHFQNLFGGCESCEFYSVVFSAARKSPSSPVLTPAPLWSRRAKDGNPEIDFDTDTTDFRLPPIQIEELRKGLRSSGTLRAEQNIPDMHYSLRVSGEDLCRLCDQI